VDDSVWDVVEFQVQKDAETERRQRLDGSGTFGGEELVSDLKESRGSAKFTRK
jgi:hypothetical protein